MRSIWDRIIKPIVQPIIDTIVKPIVDNIIKPIIDSILNPEPDNRGEKDGRSGGGGGSGQTGNGNQAGNGSTEPDRDEFEGDDPDEMLEGSDSSNQEGPTLREIAREYGLDIDQWMQGEPMSAQLMLMAAESSVMFKTVQMIRSEAPLFWTIVDHFPTAVQALAHLFAEAEIDDPDTIASAQWVTWREDQQPNPLDYMPNPNYDTRSVDESFVTEPGLGPDSEFLIDLSGDWLLWGNVPYLNALALLLHRQDALAPDAIDWWADRNDARQRLLTSALVARIAGNDDAARNLEWFVLGMGQPMTDYPVDKMINELDEFVIDIDHINQTSLPGLLAGDPSYVTDEYDIYVNNTVWRRIGQPSQARGTDRNPYLGSDGRGISTAPESPDSQYMYSGAEPTRYTREQFDWFIAMNAFDYSTSQVVIINKNTGEAQLHYQVNIGDEYAWYVNEGTGDADALMANMDEKGVGEWFPIKGSSSIYQRTFHVDDDLQSRTVTRNGEEVTEYYYELHNPKTNADI